MRTREFMDNQPDPANVPDEIIAVLMEQENWRRLCEEWDRKYPANPVDGREDTEGE